MPNTAEPMEILELMFPTTTRCIALAAQYGIADLLADGPRPVGELAAGTGTDAPNLHKILQLLAEDGIFEESSPGVFANTPRSTLLRKDVPGSQHAMARLVGEEWLWSCWGRLDHSVSTGKAAFNEIYQMNTWAWLGRNPQSARLFNDAMTDFSEALGPAIAASYAGFGKAASIADLGGGHGRFLAAILRAHPSVGRGVVVDLPQVIGEAQAREDLKPLLDQGRLELQAGDFFEGVPAGVDLYVTKQIMHSWDDEKIITLLRRTKEASPKARIAAVELVHRDGVSRFVKNFNLVMLVTMAGAIRGTDDYANVFAKGGYELTGVVPTETAFSIIEAAPVG